MNSGPCPGMSLDCGYGCALSPFPLPRRLSAACFRRARELRVALNVLHFHVLLSPSPPPRTNAIVMATATPHEPPPLAPVPPCSCCPLLVNEPFPPDSRACLWLGASPRATVRVAPAVPVSRRVPSRGANGLPCTSSRTPERTWAPALTRSARCGGHWVLGPGGKARLPPHPRRPQLQARQP